MRLLVAAAIIVVALAWGAGETHRANCIDQGHQNCSVLPWDNGHSRQATKPTAEEQRQQSIIDKINRIRRTP